jgi:hypothetical protein
LVEIRFQHLKQHFRTYMWWWEGANVVCTGGVAGFRLTFGDLVKWDLRDASAFLVPYPQTEVCSRSAGDIKNLLASFGYVYSKKPIHQ